MTVNEAFQAVTKISTKGETDTRVYSSVSVSHNIGYEAVL